MAVVLERIITAPAPFSAETVQALKQCESPHLDCSLTFIHGPVLVSEEGGCACNFESVRRSGDKYTVKITTLLNQDALPL